MQHRVKCQEEAKHVALLSQRDAPAQSRRRGQVPSLGRSRGGGERERGMERQRVRERERASASTHPTQSHVASCAPRAPSPRAPLALHIPQRCLALLRVSAKRQRNRVGGGGAGRGTERRDGGEGHQGVLHCSGSVETGT